MYHFIWINFLAAVFKDTISHLLLCRGDKMQQSTFQPPEANWIHRLSILFWVFLSFLKEFNTKRNAKTCTRKRNKLSLWSVHRGDPSARRRSGGPGRLQLTIKQCSPQPAAPWAAGGGLFPAGCGKGSSPTTQFCCSLHFLHQQCCMQIAAGVSQITGSWVFFQLWWDRWRFTTSTVINVTWSLHTRQLRPLSARTTLIRFLSSTLPLLGFSMAGLP